MSQFLVRFGTRGIFEGLMKRASKRKCLLALNLSNEAEGTRTLNLRIDSPLDDYFLFHLHHGVQLAKRIGFYSFIEGVPLPAIVHYEPVSIRTRLK